MSIDGIPPPPTDDVQPETDDSSAPKKKLTKKQKKAEAAAKRAATILAKEAAELEATATEGGKEEGAQPKEQEQEVKKEDPVVEVTEETVAQKKKDGKHKRDEDEDDEGLVITDVTAAKKVKADTGEVVRLENVDVDVGMEEIEVAVKAEEKEKGVEQPTEAPAPTPATEADTVPAPPKSIPTGPAADANKPTPTAPANRENSRLRIYFSSPVPAASTYSVHPLPPPSESDKKIPTGPAKGVPPPASTEAPREDEASAPAPTEGAGEPQGEDDPDIDGEDIDGVDVDGEPVDGEPVDGEPVDGEPVDGEPTQEDDVPTDDSDDDEVESSLVASKVKPEVQESDAAALEAQTGEEESTAAPLLDGENASYPPDPYSQGQPQQDDTASLAGGAPTDSRDVSLAPAETEPTILPPEPSADRISISYARNTRRIVIDADVVQKVKIHRADGRIELSLALKPATLGTGGSETVDEFRICKGVLVSS